MREILSSERPIRVLIVDDDDEDIFILRRYIDGIRDGQFEVEGVQSYEEAHERIAEKQHDIYLIDYRLGERDGIELLKAVKPHMRSEPFILMSGADDRELVKGSMRSAAADFVVKGGLTSEILSKTIFYALQRKQLEKQRLEHLEELNRTKDEFISIASHQLRTPATGVKQYLGMLREGFLGPVSEHHLSLIEKAYESNERQLQIVSELLRVAQVDAGKVTIRRQPVDVVAFINDIVRGFGSVFSERGQTVTLSTDDETIIASIDTDIMRMVYENIIENASKYSEEGTTIAVSITHDDMSINVAVHDEGVGIDESDQVRLFEKFSRIDNKLSTKVGGTGLGLYWAKKVIDVHDGTILYNKNDKKGSTFTIKLPKQ